MKNKSIHEIDYTTDEGRRYLKQYYNIVVKNGLYYRKCTSCGEVKELESNFRKHDNNGEGYSEYCNPCRREHQLRKFLDNLCSDDERITITTVTQEGTDSTKNKTVYNERSKKGLSNCENSPLWFLAFIGLRGLLDQGMDSSEVYSLLCKLGLEISTANYKQFTEIIESEELFFRNVRYCFSVQYIDVKGHRLLKIPNHV